MTPKKTDTNMNLSNAPQPKPAIGKKNAPAPAADTPAEMTSKERAALLKVETYEQAEALLSENPDLIQQARAVFGAIVPTSGQNTLVDLAIRAAADDAPTDLRGALKAKRAQTLNLTASEIRQLLEFAAGQTEKTPALALNVALLLTDDLTRLEDAALWQAQKDVVLKLEKLLNLDAATLWTDINDKAETRAAPPPPKPAPAKPKAAPQTPPRQKIAAPPPPPPARRKFGVGGSPSRLALAAGFLVLMSALSCGLCALGQAWF